MMKASKHKISIRTKVTLCLIGIIGSMIILSWILSCVCIKKYYYSKIKKNLQDTYSSCDKLFINDSDLEGDAFVMDIDNKSNALIYVADVSDEKNIKIYTSVKEGNKMYDSLNNMVDILMAQSGNDDIQGAYRNEVVEKDDYDKFTIQITNDKKMNSNYFDLVGTLSNGYVIVLRTSVSSVDNTISTTVSFFTIILIVVAILGCILMYFFSNIFVKPIKKITGVAAKMVNLDFDAKIDYPANDELGELSNYMNDLSDKLKLTLTELRQVNIQLQKDIDEKIQIDEMRKEFLSHVSHELKTPIALVQGYAEGLRDNINEDEESKNFYCDVIVDEAMKMNNLVKKLLALNEIEFGQNTIQKVKFNILDMIKNRIDSSEILLKQKVAKVDFSNPENAYIEVLADEFKIEEVFTNYYTNAIHYAKKDGAVKIWTEYTENEKPVMSDSQDGPQKVIGNVRVFVFDEGPNIPDEELEKIFIKFYKVDKARTREYGGSGIGLSIVAATMNAHDKEYGVYNTENGVVFYFDLDVTAYSIDSCE